MNEPKNTTRQIESTSGELTDEALDAVAGGAAFVKYDGVDGETRKGKVEATWKVEEGTV